MPRTEIPSDLKKLAEKTKSREIYATERKLGASLEALDGLIVLWMNLREPFLEATAVQVKPTWHPSLDPASFANLQDLPDEFVEIASKYREYVKRDFVTTTNFPKVWLKEFRSPLSDRPTLSMTVGKTDYLTSKCLGKSFDAGELRAKYEDGRLSMPEDLPGLLVTANVIVTSDDHIILSQRKPKETDFAGGLYSVSFEEQWNPQYENVPYEAVLRGLSEEFNIDKSHGVYVTVDNLRLLALTREWGAYWSTALIYLVQLPAKAQKVLECWNSLPPPKDKNEHVGIVAVPLREPGKSYLLRLLERSETITFAKLRDICGSNNITGQPTDQNLHDVSGRARLLFGLVSSGVL